MSKSIYHEASEVFYGDNTMIVYVDTGYVNGSQDGKYEHECIWLNGTEVEAVTWVGIVDPLDAWPQYLLRFSHWNLNVRTYNKSPAPTSRDRESDDYISAPNAHLYNLSCSLAQRSNIKYLRIKWTDLDNPSRNRASGPLGTYNKYSSYGPSEVYQYVWPLTRLCSRENVTIAGLCSETHQWVLEAMPLTSPAPVAYNHIERALGFFKAANVIIRNSKMLETSTARVAELRHAVSEFRSAHVGQEFMKEQSHDDSIYVIDNLGECVARIISPALLERAQLRATEYTTAHDELSAAWQGRWIDNAGEIEDRHQAAGRSQDTSSDGSVDDDEDT